MASSEEVVAVFKADVSQYRQSMSQLKKELSDISNLENEAKREGVESKKANEKATADLTAATQELGSVGSTVWSSLDSLTLGAAGSIKKTIVAVAGLTKGMKLLRASLISTGIGALVVALGSLISYFTQTQRGSDAVSRVFKALGATVDVVVDRLSALGESLVNAFKNPEKAVKDFAKTLKQFVMNRIEDLSNGVQGLGKAFKLLFEGEFVKAAKAAGEAAIDLVAATNPIAGVIMDNRDALASMGDEIEREAALAYELEQRMQNLRDAEIALEVERAKSRATIKELNKIGEDTDKSLLERQQAIEKALQIENALMARRQKLAEERVAIITAQNKMSENMVENDRELADAEIALANIAEESLELQTTLNNKLNVIKQQLIKTTQDQAAAERQLLEDMKSAQDEAFDLGEIENMVDSSIEEFKKGQESLIVLNEEAAEERLRVLQEEADAEDLIDLELDAKKRERMKAQAQYAAQVGQELLSNAVLNSQNRLAVLDRELETATGLQRRQLLEQRSIEEDRFTLLKRLQTGVLFIQEAAAVARAFAELGPIAGAAAAIGLAAKFAGLFKQVETQKFAEGSDMVHPANIYQGKKVDDIPAWLNKGEAVIQTDMNKKHHDLVKAIRRDRVNDFISRRYVLPELTKHAISSRNGGQSVVAALDGGLLDLQKKGHKLTERKFNELIREVSKGHRSKNRI